VSLLGKQVGEGLAGQARHAHSPLSGESSRGLLHGGGDAEGNLRRVGRQAGEGGPVVNAQLHPHDGYRRNCPWHLDCNAINDYDACIYVGGAMASITIRNLDDGLKRRLRVRAAEHGRSMEEEAREIIRQAVGPSTGPTNLGEVIHRRFATLGGIDLPLPAREPMPEPPRLD